MSDDLRGQRHDFHELLVAQLAPHGAEDAGGPRLALVRDEHGGVLVEADVGAVPALGLFGGPNDHRPDDLALLDLAGGDGVLDRDDDDVAQPGVAALGPAEHANHERFAGPRVVRDLENRLLLHHARFPPYFARSTMSTTRQRLDLDRGRVSTIRTVSPAFAPISSWAATVLDRTSCLPYRACANRRVSETVTVFCILSLTTTPVRTLRVPLMLVASRAGWCGSGRCRAGSCGTGAGSPRPPCPSGTAAGNALPSAPRASAPARPS